MSKRRSRRYSRSHARTRRVAMTLGAAMLVSFGLSTLGTPSTTTAAASTSVAGRSPVTAAANTGPIVTAPVAASVSAIPTAAAALVSPLGRTYLNVTEAMDADLKTLAAVSENAAFDTLKAAVAKIAADELTLVQQLKQTRWPVAAESIFANLATAITAEQSVYQQCAQATTAEAIRQLLQKNQSVITARVEASAQARVSLGFGAAPTAEVAPPIGSNPSPASSSG